MIYVEYVILEKWIGLLVLTKKARNLADAIYGNNNGGMLAEMEKAYKIAQAKL